MKTLKYKGKNVKYFYPYIEKVGKEIVYKNKPYVVLSAVMDFAKMSEVVTLGKYNAN